MSLFPAGSVPWLLGHELRIFFRSRPRGTNIGSTIAIGAIFLAMFVVGVPVAFVLRKFPMGPSPLMVLILDTVEVVLFTLLMSQTLAQATMVFFERGDLDLLLSSPLPAWRVLFARSLAIAAMPYLIFCTLLTPFLVPMAVLGHAAWLGSYMVLACLALGATALGLIVAMALFAVIGPRRTKTVGQVLAALIGAGFFIVAQSGNLFPGRRPELYAMMKRMASVHAVAPDGPLSWPARAVIFDPLPLFAMVAAAVALFSASCIALGARFAINASAAIGSDATRVRTTSSISARAFEGGVFAAMMRKEFTLLYRDPALVSQVLLRMLYVIPLLVVLIRNATFHLASAVATGSGALVFVASQISANLAWIAISGEDAPELLASAPVTLASIRWAKLAAAFLPLAVMLALPIAALAWFSPRAGLVAALGISCASLSSALVNIWYEKPGQRRHFRRRGSGSFLASLAELLVGVAWSGTVIAAASGTAWSMAGLSLALLLLWAFSLGRNDVVTD